MQDDSSSYKPPNDDDFFFPDGYPTSDGDGGGISAGRSPFEGGSTILLDGGGKVSSRSDWLPEGAT